MTSITDLADYSRLVEYEWRTLHECHWALASGWYAKGACIYRVLVEAGLLHRRALIMFFLDDKPRSTDISLKDWFPAGSDSICEIRACAEDIDLKAEADNVGKIVAHITKRRLPRREITFDSHSIEQVDALMYKFLELVQPGTVDATLLNLRDELRSMPSWASSVVVYSTAGGAYDKPRLLAPDTDLLDSLTGLAPSDLTNSQDPIVALAAGLSLTGDICHDAPAFLALHERDKGGHSAAVAAEARRLAARFGADPDRAERAGWLHDISVVWPTAERLAVARALGVEVLPEEAFFPLILHQKLSVVVAQRVFGVSDQAVLDAIGCHTTLRTGATLLDKVVFLADKIAWDQAGLPPYGDAVLAALDESLDRAVFAFLDYQWQHRDQLGVVHPWMATAREELGRALGLL